MARSPVHTTYDMAIRSIVVWIADENRSDDKERQVADADMMRQGGRLASHVFGYNKLYSMLVLLTTSCVLVSPKVEMHNSKHVYPADDAGGKS